MADRKGSLNKAGKIQAGILNSSANSPNGKPLSMVNDGRAVFPTTPVIDNNALNDINSVDVLPNSNMTLNIISAVILFLLTLQSIHFFLMVQLT